MTVKQAGGVSTISLDLEVLRAEVINNTFNQYVTIDTPQTITSQKTIDNKNLILNSTGDYSNYIAVRNGATAAATTRRTLIARGIVYLHGNSSSGGNPELWFGQLVNGSPTDKGVIYLSAGGFLLLNAKGGESDWTANTVMLAKTPVDSTSTTLNALATMGWVNLKFLRKPSTTGTGFLYDTNGTLSHKSFGTTAGTVAEGNHTHDMSTFLTKATLGTDAQITNLATLVASLNSSGQVPLNKLVRSTGSAARGLVASTNNGAMYLTAASYYDALDALHADYDSEADCLPYLVTIAEGGVATGIWQATSSSSHTLILPLPTTANTTYDRVLTCKKNGLVLSWEYDSSAAQSPGSAVTNLAVAVTQTTANAGTWTANGTNGVVVRRHRTVWTGTYLYGFYHDETYDKYGRLYYVSAETRYTIDTPTQVTWS
ncbi:MAG: hypothetical protein K6G94_09655 [Kiritimatiellae bacterium]|nr:hypothetical protein [Kiritimatiellia bacterium]